MGVSSTAKRRRTGTDSSINSTTPSRPKSNTGRGRGRPPNAPRDGRERPPSLADCFKRRCNDVLDRLNKKDHYNIFLEPVNTNDVAGYLDVIKQPMDFTTMRTKLSNHVYKSLGEFRKDLDLIWSNCLLFNGKEPTNVFSKKAIELRRLTEKLIATTRRELERDKELVNKWREKHRKRRQTIAANAAHSNASFHGANIGIQPSSLLSHDHHSGPPAEGRDSMLSTDIPQKDHNGRTPEQNALAESLKMQFAGGTGLHRRGMFNAPYAQYTKPDGSLVQIPVARYNPAVDYWAPRDPPSIDLYRLDAAPQLYCDSLPLSREYNPCRPEPDTDGIYVKDYAQSLYTFVQNDGPIAIEIVTELLSPELALKAQHDQLRKQGLSSTEIAKRIRAAKEKRNPGASRYPRKKNWDAGDIIQLADEIEKMNKTKISLLPRLSRVINELDGINGLTKFLDKDLVREVDDVPVETVDYAMPHGVSLQTISEIHQLAKAPALQLPPSAVQAIDGLRKAGEEYVARLGPAAASRASGLPSAQLHEAQMRALMQKRHRRKEAERQAAMIANHYGQSPTNGSELTHTAPPAAPPHASHGPMQKPSEISQPVQPIPQVADLQGNRQVNANPETNLSLYNSTPLPSVPGGLHLSSAHQVSNQLPPASSDATCSNCGTRDTLGWRAGPTGAEGVQRLCIACGLYWQKSHRHRPKELWGHSVRKQPLSTSPTTARAQALHANPQNRTLTPQGSPEGISRRPIQKKTPQSSSRRSPSSSGSWRRTPKGRKPTGLITEQSNLSQQIQPMPGLPNSIHAAAQGMQNTRNVALQGFPQQQVSAPTQNIMSTLNAQELHHEAQRPNRLPYVGGPGLNHGTPASAHQGNGFGTNGPAVYQAQQRGLPLQSHMPYGSVGLSGEQIAAQNPSYIRNGAPKANPDAQVQHAQNPSVGQQLVGVQNRSAPFSGTGAQPQMVASQIQSNEFSGSALQVNSQKNETGLPFAHTEQESFTPGQTSVGAPTHAMGSANINSYAGHAGDLAQSNIPGFENGIAHSFGNNGPASGIPASSERMMESLLFGDGGITASPPGAPEFEF